MNTENPFSARSTLQRLKDTYICCYLANQAIILSLELESFENFRQKCWYMSSCMENTPKNDRRHRFGPCFHQRRVGT